MRRSSESWIKNYYSSCSRTDKNGEVWSEGWSSSKQEVLFEPEVILQWPEGLDVARMVISLQKGNLTEVHIPVTNISNVDIMLAPCTILGRVELVRAIYPADTKPAIVESDRTDSGDSVVAEVVVTESKDVTSLNGFDNTGQDANEKLWDPLVSIDHLTPEEQRKIKQLLREECAAFSKDENDVGCIPSLQLKIRLSDMSPVKRTYVSVPKPLRKEVKEYLEDLLN